MRFLLALLFALGTAHAQDFAALRGTAASAVLIAVPDGRQLGHYGDLEREALPGSTLKPLLLEYALAHQVIGPHDTIPCDGMTRIAGHNLACVHPRAMHDMTARLALSQSCNSYFASLARHLGDRVPVALRAYGVDETAVMSADQNVLLALGLAGRTLSVEQLASTYRSLAIQINSHSAPGAQLVRDALEDSVLHGVAHAALTPGVNLAGKTGTAPGVGWFAGILFDEQGQASRILIVQLPGGNGSDAALLAHHMLAGRR